MKIGGRSGHNPLAPGASGIIDETTEARKIFLYSKKYLEKSHQFIDCYPGNMNDASVELMWGINKANSSNVDFFYSIHLNKAYDSYNGAIGSEIWVYPNCSQATKDKANRILSNFQKLGFINRGIKFSTELAELNSTSMEAMIIECFFCEATKDVELYKKFSEDKLGFAIANGIDPTIQNSTPIPEVNKVKNLIIYNNDIDKRAAEYLADFLLSPVVRESNYNATTMPAEKIFVVGGGVKTKGDIRLEGSDRYETIKAVLKYMNKL
ncbi:N-acetylmuramoyl-L-alanine amidase [Clostridium sp. CTA-19]